MAGKFNLAIFGAAAGLAILGLFFAFPQASGAPVIDETAGSMPTRALGQTGFQVSLFSLGGQAVIERPGRDEKANEIINRALDLGVNYIDTAPRYGNGVSETYIGRVMKDRRDEVFLATKSHDYSYEGTMRLIRESLERLQTDRIDLYQHHNVGTDRHLERILADDGALRAFRELKEKGVVGHIGISSHSPRVLLQALELGVYDCMLITLNPAGANMADRGHLDEFMEKAREKGVGVIAMKVVSRGTLLGRGAEMEDMMRYALSFPVAAVIVGISETWQVDENVRTAENFRELSDSEKRALEQIFNR